ncbi:phospholipid-translocating ATPase [Gymnopilus junonius]|uniref:Phospholipid-transporting ATPase n=1 Tax=Gymnopilus junonius TaxID=109634 RepID=A0A9P5P2R0_GYMJU|nr:phospholipid-translocating ATPase [Gymnopilus junonius]
MAPRHQSRIAQWYDKFAAFKVEDVFARKRVPGPQRTIFFNENLPEDYLDHKGRVKPEHVYSSNQVITSKYTLITFVPRNLLEQFRRVANMFFLGIAILQFFSIFSTISPGLVILPLLIVLGITALKDGYEDIKRHESDRRVNSTPVRVLRGGDYVNPNIMQRKSKTFVRGVMRTYGQGRKKLKNPNLDGETLANVTVPQPDPEEQNQEHLDVEFDDDSSLMNVHEKMHHKLPHWKMISWEDIAVGDFVKILDSESLPADVLICATSEDDNVAFVETKNLDGETNLKSRHAVPALSHLRTASECASPHNVFRLDCEKPDVNMYKLNAAVRAGEDIFPADMQNVLLRGTVLRNTKWVVGVVMYTGEDTRIIMNSGGTPSKRSRVERQMNPQVFINLVLLAIMAVVCGIVDSVLEHRKYPEGAPWLYDANRPSDNPSINGLVTFAFALITFQNIVPISLYISIEFVRTCQAAFIYFDYDMVYNGQATLARSWNLSDDLGQIEYIFSDKTGTLTQNSMVFRQCTIGGKTYTGEPSEEAEKHDEDEDRSTLHKHGSLSPPPAYMSGGSAHEGTNIPLEQLRSDGSSTAYHPPSTHPLTAPPKVIPHFHDAELNRDLDAAVQGNLDPTYARLINGFFSVLALCHTVLTNIDPDTGKIEYKAQSPDEAALVQAAADVGFVFRGREREILYLQTPFGVAGGWDSRSQGTDTKIPQTLAQEAEAGLLERYELLNILEFTSARKRMSVVLRKLDGDDGRLFLLSKGADNVIFERLRAGGDELKKVTEKHLDEFASQGLRTLTLAYKVVPEEEYLRWSERYHAATVSLDDRDGKIDAVSDELERDLRLLGATAIEDRLQDGVPETIADLKRAGIKIWVATGDKLETAIAIGHSTNLIGFESNIIVIRGNKSGRSVYDQIMHAVEEFFPDAGILDEDGNPTPPSEATAHVINGGRPQNGFGDGNGGPLHRVETGLSSVVGHNNGDRPGGFVLVIDGQALEVALSDDRHKDLLLRLAMVCEGVICCRVSPLQKALVVKLVKDGIGAMTLAIGDGANDVSMIQAADVGVGISGEEGLQAVNSSDYAIAQFRFLKRLLLVHGHWSYARNGTMILNFFYKNIVCIGVLWWFQIYDGWSSNYVLEYTYLLFWNSFWTIAPVIGIGLFDRFVDDHVLMAVPELYRYGREGKWFGLGQFTIYMFDAVYQSAIIYFLILYTYFSTSARSDGWSVTQYEFSTVMVFSAVFAANFFNGLNSSAWTFWVFFCVFIGDLLVWVYTLVYNAIGPGWFVTWVYGNNHFLFPSPLFWFSLPLTIFLSILPRYLYKAENPTRDLTHDPLIQAHLRSLKRSSMMSHIQTRTGTESVASLAHPSMENYRSGSRTDMSTGLRSVNRGFDFSTEEVELRCRGCRRIFQREG